MRIRFPAICLLPLLLILSFAPFGCSSADHPTAPSGTTLTITASSTKIGLNGTAQVSVTGFRPDGNRLAEGTLVRFTASLGTIDPAVTTIGADGYARAVFRADGRAGTASITANLSTGSGTGGGGGGDGSGDGDGGGGGSGAGTGTESASVSIEVSTEQPTLLISANPTTVDLGEISVVTITARDENSIPLGAGEEILLTANLGHLEKDGQSVDRVLTEADGRARVDFVAGNETGDGMVDALLRNSEQVSVTINIREAPTQIDLDPSALEINSSGTTTLTLTATVLSAQSRPVSQIGVEFQTTLGDVTPNVDLTDAAGVATSTLTVTQSDLDANPGIERFFVTALFTFDDAERSDTVEIRVGGAGAGGGGGT